MRRNHEVIRRILLAMEEQDPGDEGRAIVSLSEDGHDSLTLIGHVELMMDDGLVAEHRGLVTGVPNTGVSLRLTSLGHDLLDQIREELNAATIGFKPSHTPQEERGDRQ